jgi:hypothetical protein
VERPLQQKEVINSVVTEQQERYRRRKNVIVFVLPVSMKSSKQDQENDDKREIDRILTKLNVDTKCITYTRRFRSTNVGSRPPPVLVQLINESDKFAVLKAAKELRKIDGYKDVYINPDMTQAERILDKQMRESRYQLNQREINFELKNMF